MRRASLALILFVLAPCLSLTGCGEEGIGDLASYREATKGFDSALKAADRAHKEGQMSGDPMRLRDAFDKLLPAVKNLDTVLAGFEVSEPALAAIHNDFVAAVKMHVDTVHGMHPTIMKTPLTISKPMLTDSQKDLHDAHEAWQAALDESGL